jgi:hypothetical protein
MSYKIRIIVRIISCISMSLHSNPLLLQEKPVEAIVVSSLKRAIEKDDWESAEQRAAQLLDIACQVKIEDRNKNVPNIPEEQTKSIKWTAHIIDAVREAGDVFETVQRQSKEIAALKISEEAANSYAEAATEIEIAYAIAKGTVLSHFTKLYFHLGMSPSSEASSTPEKMHLKDTFHKLDKVNSSVQRSLNTIDLYISTLEHSIKDIKTITGKVFRCRSQETPLLRKEIVPNLLDTVAKVHSQTKKLADQINSGRPKEGEQNIPPELMWDIWIKFADSSTIVSQTAAAAEPIAKDLHQRIKDNIISDDDIVQSIGRIEVLIEKVSENLSKMQEDTQKILKK